MTTRPEKTRPLLVYGVTVGESAQTLLRGQLRWFTEQGWDVTLITSPGPAATTAAASEGIDLHPLRMRRSITPFSDMIGLCKWIWTLLRLRPEAVNVSTPKAGLLGGLAAWLTRIPRRVYVVRGLRLEGVSGILQPILWLFERLSIAVATDVVIVSQSLARELLRHRLIRLGEGWLIGSGSSNGVDVDAITKRVAQSDKGDLRRKLGIDQDSFVVGFIGRMATDKGLYTIKAALADSSICEKVELLIIGENPEELEPSTDRRLHVIGWTDDVWGYLSAIDVLCLPTRREGFPNVVLEAAAAGIPSITTRATGAIDSVIHGSTGFLIDIDDSSDLVSCFNRLANDPALVRKLGEAAKSRAAVDFRPENIWEGLAAVVEGRPSDRNRRVSLKERGR